MSGAVYFFVTGFCSGMSLVEFHGIGQFEAAFQSALKLTNVGIDILQDESDDDDDDEKGNPYHRKMTFIWYMVLYSLILILILVVYNVDQDFEIFNLIQWQWRKAEDISLITYKNGLYLNLIVGGTICIGVFSFILDFLYSCINCGVFVFQ